MSDFILIGICIFFSAILVFIIVALAGVSALSKRRQEQLPFSRIAARFAHWMATRQPWFMLFFLIAFLVCVIGSTVYYSGNFLPYPPATPAADVVPLFNITVIITGAAFFLTQILLFYFAFRFRTKRGTQARFIAGNLKLEFFWTIIPALTFLLLFFWGQHAWQKMIAAAPDNALVVEVVAEQFNWKARYAGKDGELGRSGFRFVSAENRMGIDVNDPAGKDDFVPVQMHIPKGRVIELRLWSKDVIHSFFIPFFRTKMDALPGMVTTTHFTATATTEQMRDKLGDPDFNYEVACAELCGRMHFAMKLILVVDEPEAFDAWCATQENLAMEHTNKQHDE